MPDVPLADGSVAITVATAVASGGSALMGVALGAWLSGRREQARFRTECVLELAQFEKAVWSEDWGDLRTQLREQHARLAVAGVPAHLTQALREISLACWRDLQRSIEESDGQHSGITTKLLDAREAVHDAVQHRLLRDRSRGGQRDSEEAAILLVDETLAKRD